MNVEQAIFGEVRGGGHGLRASSRKCVKVAQELASKMDLPDAAPPGVRWDPYLTGFAHCEHFILARTFPDSNAQRAGMVLAHALLAPLEEMARSDDLGSVIACLATGANAIPEAAALDVTLGSALAGAAPDLDAIAEALVARGTGPVIRVGTQGFDDLVSVLWANFWPELRRGFSFRISFGPSDVEAARSPVLVCTPSELASRWIGRRTVWPGTAVQLSTAAAILAGRRPAGPILDLGRRVGARTDRIEELPLLVALHDAADSSRSCLDAAIAAIRLAERISPDAASGAELKQALVRAASGQIRSASPTLVLHLRNITTTAFADAAEFWQALNSWMRENSFEAGSDAALESILHHATGQGSAVPEWSAAIASGFSDAANARSQSLAAAFWRWTERVPDIVNGLFKLLPVSRETESWLSAAAPSRMSRLAASTIGTAALGRRWLRLHGDAVSAAYPPSEAVAAQLKVDIEPGFLDGVRSALRLAGPGEVVWLAVDLREERLIDLAAEHVAKHPALLSEARMDLPGARSVWARSVALNPDAWRGPKDPVASFHAVLDLLLEGAAVDHGLIDALARSPLGDVGAYARRAELWDKLAQDVSSRILSATALGWLGGIQAGGEPSRPDPRLEAAIMSRAELDSFFRVSTGTRAGVALNAVLALATLPEERFKVWLGALVADPTPVSDWEATRAGRLVAERRWRRSAEKLATALEQGRGDLTPAVRQAEHLLGFFTRFMLRLSPIGADEKWHMLEELGANLYPSGPEDEQIWARSGGRLEDLRGHGSGRAKWADAMVRIRNGGRGPSAPMLISEMVIDYPLNRELSILSEAFRSSR